MKPTVIEDQCFADLQSAHSYEGHDYVVGAVYFDPDRDLVGRWILVEDMEGPTAFGVIIEQNQGLILIALDPATWES